MNYMYCQYNTISGISECSKLLSYSCESQSLNALLDHEITLYDLALTFYSTLKISPLRCALLAPNLKLLAGLNLYL